MLATPTSPRLHGEPLDCGRPRPAGRRSRPALLTALVALAFTALLPAAAPAQTNQQIPPALQQPLPVQPGQTPAQQAPQQPAQPPAGQAAPQGQAQAEPPGQQHGSWAERCTPTPPPGASPPRAGEQNVCFLIQQVIDQNSQQPMLKITIGFFGPQRQPRAIIAMPLGVPLAHGIQISVDGKRVGAIPFDVCRRDGCLANILLDDTVVSAFKAGSTAQARVESEQGEGVNIPISLQGFTAGYGAIQ